MKESNKKRKIEIYYKNYLMGTLFDKDESGLYTYSSNIANEKFIMKKYYLPKSYEEEMMSSVEKKAVEFKFMSSICARLSRPDIRKMLKISDEDSEFDMLFKLAKEGEFIGENFVLKAKEMKGTEQLCQQKN